METDEIIYEIEKNWKRYTWERSDLLDTLDEYECSYIMTSEIDGVVYEGTGWYTCGELISVDDITRRWKE